RPEPPTRSSLFALPCSPIFNSVQRAPRRSSVARRACAHLVLASFEGLRHRTQQIVGSSRRSLTMRPGCSSRLTLVGDSASFGVAGRSQDLPGVSRRMKRRTTAIAQPNRMARGNTYLSKGIPTRKISMLAIVKIAPATPLLTPSFDMLICGAGGCFTAHLPLPVYALSARLLVEADHIAARIEKARGDLGRIRADRLHDFRSRGGNSFYGFGHAVDHDVDHESRLRGGRTAQHPCAAYLACRVIKRDAAISAAADVPPKETLVKLGRLINIVGGHLDVADFAV